MWLPNSRQPGATTVPFRPVRVSAPGLNAFPLPPSFCVGFWIRLLYVGGNCSRHLLPGQRMQKASELSHRCLSGRPSSFVSTIVVAKCSCGNGIIQEIARRASGKEDSARFTACDKTTGLRGRKVTDRSNWGKLGSGKPTEPRRKWLRAIACGIAQPGMAGIWRLSACSLGDTCGSIRSTSTLDVLAC
ncbi:hypothetical protein BCV70DRAFT_26923 [Testicularia cyperi]|uniref:Uncharacterized protein n=1 Tax=Testicularia cyperi TaxID=1882483 RepID=A0A317XK94_9BASI|nr:hypothetical protein BCV70DRAFT_26923 [Testicularia cyperi]